MDLDIDIVEERIELYIDNIRKHFSKIPDNALRTIIFETLDLFEMNNIKIFYNKKVSTSYDGIEQQLVREITIIDSDDNEIGHFRISGTYLVSSNVKDYFDSGRTIDMSIGTDETMLGLDGSTISLRGRQLSRIMIGELLLLCLSEYNVRNDQLIFIDVDGSTEYNGRSFWNIMGMIPNTDYYDREEGKGFEKEIEFGNIFKWVFKQSMPRRSRRLTGRTTEITGYERKRGGNKRKTMKIKNNTRHKKNKKNNTKYKKNYKKI